MDFKGWLITENENVEQFLNWFGQQVLASTQPGQGFVSIKFPDPNSFFLNARQAPQASQAPTAAPMPLAASTRLPGPLLREGLNQDDPHGKGGLAYTATKHMLPKWSPQQVLNFKVGLRDNIAKIGRDLGYLFELEIFQYLVQRKKLQPFGENEFTTYGLEDSKQAKSGVLANIARFNGPQLTKQYVQFVQAHAWGVAEQIYQKTVQILEKCRVDYVEFLGSHHGGDVSMGRRDPADIKIGCSEVTRGRKAIGYSAKFTSESKVHITSQRAESLYELMGGKNSAAFATKLDSVLINYKKAKDFLLRTFAVLAEKYEGNPVAFTEFLEELLTGGNDTLPAARLYIRQPAPGNNVWSQAMQQDFITSDNRTGKLRPKPGATVTVNATNTYIKLTYTVPGGSRNGTFIVLEPYLSTAKAEDIQDDEEWDFDKPTTTKQIAKINVKMNNLAAR